MVAASRRIGDVVLKHAERGIIVGSAVSDEGVYRCNGARHIREPAIDRACDMRSISVKRDNEHRINVGSVEQRLNSILQQLKARLPAADIVIHAARIIEHQNDVVARNRTFSHLDLVVLDKRPVVVKCDLVANLNSVYGHVAVTIRHCHLNIDVSRIKRLKNRRRSIYRIVVLVMVVVQRRIIVMNNRPVLRKRHIAVGGIGVHDKHDRVSRRVLPVASSADDHVHPVQCIREQENAVARRRIIETGVHSGKRGTTAVG